MIDIFAEEISGGTRHIAAFAESLECEKDPTIMQLRPSSSLSK
jgi:hypothetical protein